MCDAIEISSIFVIMRSGSMGPSTEDKPVGTEPHYPVGRGEKGEERGRKGGKKGGKGGEREYKKGGKGNIKKEERGQKIGGRGE